MSHAFMNYGFEGRNPVTASPNVLMNNPKSQAA